MGEILNGIQPPLTLLMTISFGDRTMKDASITRQMGRFGYGGITIVQGLRIQELTFFGASIIALSLHMFTYKHCQMNMEMLVRIGVLTLQILMLTRDQA